MIIKVNNNSFFVFDLDDTLYLEIDFLKSAYHSISNEISPEISKSLYDEMLKIHSSGGNTFEYLIKKLPEKNLTIEKLLYLYRNHYPDILLREGVLELLIKIKKKNGKIGMITDGKSITQRNKIKALGLEKLIDKLVISEEFGCEKPASSLYESFIEKDATTQFYYIGDNINKDFISPKKLSWCCIGVLDKRSIHKQKLSEFAIEYLPHFFINDFKEIEII
jgi:putative hydrolase of the HAD superfamily